MPERPLPAVPELAQVVAPRLAQVAVQQLAQVVTPRLAARLMRYHHLAEHLLQALASSSRAADLHRRAA